MQIVLLIPSAQQPLPSWGYEAKKEILKALSLSPEFPITQFKTLL